MLVLGVNVSNKCDPVFNSVVLVCSSFLSQDAGGTGGRTMIKRVGEHCHELDLMCVQQEKLSKAGINEPCCTINLRLWLFTAFPHGMLLDVDCRLILK